MPPAWRPPVMSRVTDDLPLVPLTWMRCRMRATVFRCLKNSRKPYAIIPARSMSEEISGRSAAAWSARNSSLDEDEPFGGGERLRAAGLNGRYHEAADVDPRGEPAGIPDAVVPARRLHTVCERGNLAAENVVDPERHEARRRDLVGNPRRGIEGVGIARFETRAPGQRRIDAGEGVQPERIVIRPVDGARPPVRHQHLGLPAPILWNGKAVRRSGIGDIPPDPEPPPCGLEEDRRGVRAANAFKRRG